MSLYGYKPKYKKALWAAMCYVKKVKPKRFIRPASKRKQSTNAEYRREARQVVISLSLLGVTCPVVDSIPELRDGKMYGHKISNKLNEIHHTRGRLGSLLTDKRYWLAVSKQGHRWIHSNITEARKRGWICEKGKWNVAP